ncbi:hypothetical protein Taro_015123 [Colocasia esculenta]|uniref:VOC domain-containing protein n=1 Tax=Colocasia esculenta TaxID=4460 RepID=A0A843UKJ5_COLES|nr:hypothetical protein [Colocasia esculenta]
MAQEGGVEAAPAVVEQENGGTKAAVFVSLKPQLVVPAQKADEAVQFYKAAFGAEEVKRVNYPKRKADQEVPFVLCAELKIGSCSLLVCDQSDDAAESKVPGEGVVFRLETQDVDAAIGNAVKAGAVLDGELAEMEGPCGGSLVGKLRDPFGQVWIVASVGNCSAAGAEATEP